ncbi:hypothetical protein ABZP36_010504 [Zizania latifolia]
MAGANESTRIVLSVVFLLLPLAAAASSLPLLNSSLPDPTAVVADFHRYRRFPFRGVAGVNLQSFFAFRGVVVTKRVDTEDGRWSGWNWRTEGDMMVNGAFFVPSGEGLEAIYDKASSTDPKSSALVDQLTAGAGVLGGPRDNGEAAAYAGVNYAGVGTGGSGGGGGGGGVGDGYGYLGMVYANGGNWSCRADLTLQLTSLVLALVALICLHPL